MPVSHTHLSEIQVAATKLVFSAWWRPRGCGRLFFIGCCAVCFGCLRKRRWKFAPFSGYRMENKFCFQDQLLYANPVRHATTPGPHHAEKSSFVSTNAISEREGGGPGHWFGRRIAELSIYLPSRSAFWRIVFDWLPSDTKRAVSCEMHQDFGANARVPPKSAPGRLENASSAVSLPNQCPGPSPSLSVHYLHLQSVITQQNPNLYVIVTPLKPTRQKRKQLH